MVHWWRTTRTVLRNIRHLSLEQLMNNWWPCVTTIDVYSRKRNALTTTPKHSDDTLDCCSFILPNISASFSASYVLLRTTTTTTTTWIQVRRKRVVFSHCEITFFKTSRFLYQYDADLEFVTRSNGTTWRHDPHFSPCSLEQNTQTPTHPTFTHTYTGCGDPKRSDRHNEPVNHSFIHSSLLVVVYHTLQTILLLIHSRVNLMHEREIEWESG